MEDACRERAALMRSLLRSGQATPAVFRTSLKVVPAIERDAWVDLVLGLDELPGDDPDLPQGCVPYVPCPVETLRRAVECANVQPGDVFVDVGSGLGRAATCTQLLTGASTIGIEIQPRLVRASRELASSLNLSRFSVVEGDAAALTGFIVIGTVFFLYCPFSGERLERVLDGLEPIARTRQIRVCCVDLPLPWRPWLTRVAPYSGNVGVYQSPQL